MPYARRWKWLRDATGETTVRGAARKCGVSHTTIQRWLKSGLPAGVMCEMMVQYNLDPIEAAVVWGFLPDEHIGLLNYEAMARYVPIRVLTQELDRRVAVYSATRPDSERRESVGMLRRATGGV